MEEQERKPLRKELDQKKRQLAELRPALHSINAVKEGIYRELKEVQERIKAHFSRIAMLREERNRLTVQVQALKQERDNRNVLAQEKKSERKKVEEHKKAALQELERKEYPHALKARIKALDTKIETEAIPFEKEQQLTKQRKGLKAQLKKTEEFDDLWKELKSVSAELAQARRGAEECHQEVQLLARQAQERHVEMTLLLREVKALRQKEKQLLEQYRQHKGQYLVLKRQAEELLQRIKEISFLLQDQERKEITRRAQAKTAEIREKLKTKKKLSTEDILAFQALED